MKFTACLSRCAALLALVAGCRLAHATTYYSDPVAGSAQGDGSAKSPWPKLEAMVRNGRLPQLHAGDTLLLRNGNHGKVRFMGDNDAPITIAAEPGQKPGLARLEIVSGSNWMIKGLTITSALAEAPYKRDIVTLADGGAGHDITLQDCFVYSALDSSAWDKNAWMDANNGIMVGRNGTGITVRNNYILNTRFGVSMCAPDSLFEGNVVANFSGDGLRIVRDGITVRYNVIKNAYVNQEDGDANHDDLIQCFLFNKGTGTVRRETVTENILIGNEDPNQALRSTPQGMGFFDGPLLDFDIEKNIVVTNHYHGISLYDAVNCKIIGNAVRAASEQKAKPWIMLGTKNVGGASGNVVRDNMANSFVLKADATVKAENNVPLDGAVFEQKMQDLAKAISDKFGAIHTLSGLPRLAPEPRKYLQPGGANRESAP